MNASSRNWKQGYYLESSWKVDFVETQDGGTDILFHTKGLLSDSTRLSDDSLHTKNILMQLVTTTLMFYFLALKWINYLFIYLFLILAHPGYCTLATSSVCTMHPMCAINCGVDGQALNNMAVCQAVVLSFLCMWLKSITVSTSNWYNQTLLCASYTEQWAMFCLRS